MRTGKGRRKKHTNFLSIFQLYIAIPYRKRKQAVEEERTRTKKVKSANKVSKHRKCCGRDKHTRFGTALGGGYVPIC